MNDRNFEISQRFILDRLEWLTQTFRSLKTTLRVLLAGLLISIVYTYFKVSASSPESVKFTKYIYSWLDMTVGSVLSALFAIVLIQIFWDTVSQYYLDRKFNTAFLIGMSSSDPKTVSAINNITLDQRYNIIENIAHSINPSTAGALTAFLKSNLSNTNIRKDFSIDIDCSFNKLDNTHNKMSLFKDESHDISLFEKTHFWMTQVISFKRDNILSSDANKIKICLTLSSDDLIHVLDIDSYFFREVVSLDDKYTLILKSLPSTELHNIVSHLFKLEASVMYDEELFTLNYCSKWIELSNGNSAIEIEIDPTFSPIKNVELKANDGCDLSYSLPQKIENNWCVVVFPEPTLVDEIRIRASNNFHIVAHEFMNTFARMSKTQSARANEIVYKPKGLFHPNTGVLFQLEHRPD